LTSPDGQEGYPGTLHVTADYVWDNENTLSIRFQASTDQATHVNLTNHAYFNLGGLTNLEGLQGGTVYDHSLSVESIEYVPVDANMIPTGNTASVVGTPLDFTKPTDIGDRIHQLEQTRGYDHCFVVNGPAGTLRPAATVYHPGSGRTMVVRTTQPGVQLYTGNFLDGTWASGGFKQHEAFCLETQHYPDSPNQRTFPTTLLKPGEKLDETTTFEFGTRA
jgi:aldose 1-epimerase